MAKKNKDDFSIDLSFFKRFFSGPQNANAKRAMIVLLILIPIFFSIFFRMYSYNLPVTDEWAYSNVYNSVRSQITNQVNQQYPNLPTANKNQLIEQQVADFLSQQGPSLDAQVQAISNDLKTRFQDETGQTYLLAIDPYLYLRYTQNVLDNGHVGDFEKDGKPFDDHGIAPLGGTTRNSLHPFFEAFWHKFHSLFGNPSLMKSIFFVPIILSALAVIPAFFITRKRVGYFGGFVAAMIVAIHPAFIGRTAGGFADTDAYNVLFPLLIAWIFIEAFESDNWKKQLSLLVLGGFVVGLYSFAWSGWWYIFDFLIGVVLVYLGFTVIKSLLKNKGFSNIWSKDLKNSLIALGLFIVFSGIFVSIFMNFSSFKLFITGPFAFKIIKQAAKPDLWPNVYTTVAELNPASIGSIISQIGGKLMFFIAGLGVVLTMIKKDEFRKKDFLIIGLGAVVYLLLITNAFIAYNPITYIIIFLIPLGLGLLLLLKDDRDIDVKYALFLTIWFVGTIYASTKGTRFVLLLVPAFGIAFGIAIGMIQSILSDLAAKEFGVNKKIVSAGFMILLLLLLINPIKAADRTAHGEVPSMNDAWWDSLTRIKNNSTENAIITSWWDFGHWFKAIADRPVTFDGGSQNRPQAHWVGKILMSDDEQEAVGILRMLDCGANNAFDTINKKYTDTEKSVDMVYEIIMMEREEARNHLVDNGFENADEILGYTHCEPPEAFFITSGDMVGKAGVWSHFGSWDFEKSFIYYNTIGEEYQDSVTLLTERFGFTEDEASTYYYEVQSLRNDQEVNNWIAPWPNYPTPSMRGCINTSAEIVECNVGLGIGDSNQGHNVMINKAIINLSNPSESMFELVFVDPNTGLAAGRQETRPQGLVIADEELVVYDTGGTEILLSIVFDKVTNRAIVTHPDLSASLFTRLFFLEGRYTEHFERFSDLTSVSGSRILIWKVIW